MKKIKVFVSMPMNGKTAIQIKKELKKIELKLNEYKLRNKSIQVISGYNKDYKNKHPVYCMGKSIQAMSKADCVYFADGWDKARGCIIENLIASKYGIPILTSLDKVRLVGNPYFDYFKVPDTLTNKK